MPLIPVDTSWIDNLPHVGSDRAEEIKALNLLVDKIERAFQCGAFDVVDVWLSHFPSVPLPRLLLVGFLRFSVCAVHRGHLPCFSLAVWRVWLLLEKMGFGDSPDAPSADSSVSSKPSVSRVLRGLVKPGSSGLQQGNPHIWRWGRNCCGSV